MEEDIDSINVVPLVDVMLVLLTIVLTTATFIATGRIPVDLARSTQAAAAESESLVLTLTRDRKLYLNDVQVVNLEQSLARHPTTQPVTVRADGGLPLTEFVEVVDRVKAIGFKAVALQVRRS